MSLHSNPGSARGNAHGFMVVTLTATRRECIAQPEAVFGRDTVRDVRKTCRAPIGGNDEIGIILIGTPDMLRLDHLTSAQVGGNIQQTAASRPVARNAITLYLGAGRAG